MGRPKLSVEKRREVEMQLIRITNELIHREGLGAVTIRKIAQEAGLNSAILYKYFADLDELLMFACVDIFKAYPRELAQSEKRMELASPEKVYLITWELFCKHAFAYPECMHHLFFGKHSDQLGHVVADYYELFPEQLAGMSDDLQVMIRTSKLRARNLEVLRPLLRGREPEARLNLINDLTVSFFHTLLLEKMSGGDAVDNGTQTARMLEACRLLIA
ncbi:MAG: TetR/AcrR family transcriptional regulator [Clostridia bacterium]|nr:TetR/AcrR family transcriptional regulator [Clostridia bacterium]